MLATALPWKLPVSMATSIKAIVPEDGYAYSPTAPRAPSVRRQATWTTNLRNQLHSLRNLQALGLAFCGSCSRAAAVERRPAPAAPLLQFFSAFSASPLSRKGWNFLLRNNFTPHLLARREDDKIFNWPRGASWKFMICVRQMRSEVIQLAAFAINLSLRLRLNCHVHE